MTSNRCLHPRRIVRALHFAWAFAGVLTPLSSARADQLPLWEAGAGAAVVDFPDYRGSDHRRTYALPVPYLVYRGERLQIDRQKVRGLLFSSDIAELDVSVSGSVPVKSKNNPARRGMPDLDPTVEFGPSVNVFLYRGFANRMSVELRTPLRAVEATDLHSAHHAGWLFHPHVNVDVKDVGPGRGWHLGVLAGPLYGSRKYHDYFYGVAPQFATPERPAFEAKAGYSGFQMIAAVSKRYRDYWVGAFIKADSLHSAAFIDSPLVKRDYALAAGVAVAWVFARSSRTVEAND